MTKQQLLEQLKLWKKCESYVDREGNISPSAIAIDTIHYYFIKSDKFTKYIQSISFDKQGGILVSFHVKNNSFRFMVHVLFDGILDYYKIDKKEDAIKERLGLMHQEEGFGTEKYQF